MQDRSLAYYPAYVEDDLSRGVGEVVVHQGAFHQEVAVADDHQTCHCQVVAVVCLDAQSL